MGGGGDKGASPNTTALSDRLVYMSLTVELSRNQTKFHHYLLNYMLCTL